jgi:two-component system CheB/CheR fusion protein
LKRSWQIALAIVVILGLFATTVLLTSKAVALEAVSSSPSEARSLLLGAVSGAVGCAAACAVLLAFRKTTGEEPAGRRTKHLEAALENAERAGRELRAAKEAAEAENRVKGTFLAVMSHEIRTPLTAILGYAGLLRKRLADDGEALEDIATIERSGCHLLELMEDILDLSKIEAGQAGIDAVECAPLHIVEDVLCVMRPRSIEKGLLLQENHDPDLPEWITSDPTRIRQVLLNLVGNAIKFTETGSVVLTLSRTGANPEDVRLEFRVKDTGIGIPEDKIRALFRPFTQIDRALSRKHGGTGLGLSISHRLAQLLGGSLVVESKPGIGSTFTFSIPCRVPATAGEARQLEAAAPAASG